jgi:hypothetical protein
MIERGQVSEVGIADELVASLGPAETMEVVVVTHNDHPVLGHAHVRLDHMRTALNLHIIINIITSYRVLECLQSVFIILMIGLMPILINCINNIESIQRGKLKGEAPTYIENVIK